MAKKMPVLIIGAGNIGQAIGKVISKNASIGYWDKDPAKIKGERDLEKAIQKARVIFLCTPSWTIRSIARDIAEAIRSRSHALGSRNNKPRTKLVISLSKGIEEGTAKLPCEILEEELKNKADRGVLAGPMIAGELKKGEPAAAIVGLDSSKWRQTAEKLFTKTNLSISFSSDLKGLSLCSALKNIYAVGLGVAEGLKEETNMKSVITEKALNEMLEIVPRLGGKKETVTGLAGLGDLLTTGWSEKSYNFSVGEKLARHNSRSAQNPKSKTQKPKSEGTVSLGGIAKLLGAGIKEYPLLQTIKGIVEGRKAPKELIETASE